MPSRTSTSWTSSFTRVTAAFAVMLGGSVLVAWSIGHPTAPSILPERPPMLADAACGLVLCGLALWLLAPPGSTEPGGRGRLRTWLGRSAGVLALALAVAGFLDHAMPGPILAWPWARHWIAQSSANELATLALASLATMSLDVKIGRVRLCRVFAAAVIAITLVALVGLVYGAPALYGRSPTNGMSIPTVMGYGAVALGVLLARPGEGSVAVMLARGSGGTVARRLLPVAFLLPIVLGGALLVGEERGWYARPTSTALLVSGTVLLLGVAVVLSAMSLDRRERERSRLLEAAQIARARADEASAAKSRFLATMSHELRTPLNAILGYTELMELGVAGPVSQGQRDYHERVRASGRHLLGLINEVLDFSKLEAGQITIEPSESPAIEALAAALGLVRPQAASRRIELREQLDCPSGARFRADPDRVRQVLVNLLSNAVKFTADGGSVVASCGQFTGDGPFAAPTEHGWIYFRVQDTGIGIPREEQERVFEPFVQVDGGHTRRSGGTGLGLTISRRLARLMGGEITLESRVGQGSIFTLWLPATSMLTVEAPVTSCNVGLALKANVDTVVESFLDRLRADPALPSAASASQSALEDHTAALVMDLAQRLVIIDEGRQDTTRLIRDGVVLQRRLCELHGAQRYNLGWSEAALDREYLILRDAIGDCLLAHTPLETHAQIEDALQVMHVFLDEAALQSRAGWKRAARRGLRALS